VRPSGFEPETCGLRLRGGGVHGVRLSPLISGYVQTSSMKLGISRPRIVQVVGRIMGDSQQEPFGFPSRSNKISGRSGS
jgi:hypothetical protein